MPGIPTFAGRARPSFRLRLKRGDGKVRCCRPARWAGEFGTVRLVNEDLNPRLDSECRPTVRPREKARPAARPTRFGVWNTQGCVGGDRMCASHPM